MHTTRTCICILYAYILYMHTVNMLIKNIVQFFMKVKKNFVHVDNES